MKSKHKRKVNYTDRDGGCGGLHPETGLPLWWHNISNDTYMTPHQKLLVMELARRSNWDTDSDSRFCFSGRTANVEAWWCLVCPTDSLEARMRHIPGVLHDIEKEVRRLRACS